MDNNKRAEKLNEGLSLKAIHTCLIIITIIASVILLITTFRTTSKFNDIVNVTEESIELDEAAHELMEASDYLTESVQRFTQEMSMLQYRV